MSNTELFLTCLRHYADKNLEGMSAMFAEEIHLRDWNISVHGKAAALRATAENFAAAESIEIHVLALYENADTVAGEVHIVVNDAIHLYAVDIMRFDANGRIVASRSYKGRGD